MLDAKQFRPCSDRENHWIEVRVVPEKIYNHGSEKNPILEIVPATEVPTGFEIAGRPGQTLQDLVDELNSEAA